MPPENPHYIPPHQPQPPQPTYSIDYLNEISRPMQNRGGPSIKLMVAVIIAGLLAVVLFAFMLLNAQPSVNDEARQLHLRLSTLQTIAEDQQKELRSNDLRAINSSYILFLTDSLESIEVPLQNLGVNMKKTDKKTAAKEAAYEEKLAREFEDDRLNAVLDRTYPRDMAYELSVVKSMMKAIYSKTSSKSTKEFLEKADANLSPIAKRFTDFSNTSN